MEPNLYTEYSLIKNGIKSANAFSKLIKNNEALRNELLLKSDEISNSYSNPTDIQRLKFIFEDKSINLCDCGNPRSWRNFKKGYNQTCGNKECIKKSNNRSIKKFYQDNYGVDYLFQVDEFKSKLKEKFISKYGVDNPGKSEKIKEKIKRTNLEKFGESNWLKVDKNKKLISESISKKNMIERIKKIENLKFDIIIKEFNTKYVIIHCKKCEKITEQSPSFFNKRIAASQNPCLECNPCLYAESKGESELYSYINEIYDGQIIKHERKVCGGVEIDIFLPSLNIGFEFHGTWWHSEAFKGKFGNLEKKNIIEKLGIKIYHIWEDNWIYKKEITKSRILGALGILKKIHARKCNIMNISSNIEKEFLESNHIQGYVPSKIKIGLFYMDELVCLMTFGSKRKSLGQKSKEGEYELLRFCNKMGHSVIGGASKIFTKFIKEYSPEEVISYQDNSWHIGNLYSNIGFDFHSKSNPNYYWCKGNIRYHRFNFRKDKLIKDGFDPQKTENVIMTERGYYKLWDFGNLKWEYKKKT